MIEVDALCKKIAEAFKDVPHPGDGRLIPETMKNDRWSADVASGFAGKTWQTLTKEEVREHCDDLPLLTPAAFRYFLPAFMIHRTRTPLDVNTAGSSVVHLLTPPQRAREPTGVWWSQRENLFDRTQSEAIAAFLGHEDDWLRADWAKMGKHLTTTEASKALTWWRERASGLVGGGP